MQYESLGGPVSTRLMVGDRQGKLLAELSGTIDHVYWRLNQVGPSKVKLSRRDNKLTRKNLLPGNRVLIKFNNGLPDFGGVMDLPYKWSLDGVEVSIYSAEHVLSYAATRQDKSFFHAACGTIAKELVVNANQEYEIGVGIGEIYAGGMHHSLQYHFANVLAVIREDLCGNLSTCDFDVLPVLDRGRIEFVFNFYKHKGRTEPRASLVSGANLADEELEEQGPIINQVLAAGGGSDWGPDRPVSTPADAESVALYGRRADAFVFNEIDSTSSVNEAALRVLAVSKAPRRMAPISALNEGPYTFADYDVGDAIRVIMPKMGFDGFDEAVRLVGREYYPETNVCKLVTQ